MLQINTILLIYVKSRTHIEDGILCKTNGGYSFVVPTWVADHWNVRDQWVYINIYTPNINSVPQVNYTGTTYNGVITKLKKNKNYKLNLKKNKRYEIKLDKNTKVCNT